MIAERLNCVACPGSARGRRRVSPVNLPLGVLGLWLARTYLVQSRAPGHRASPDLPGALLVAASAGLLTLAIVQGGAWGWTSPSVLGSFAAAMAAGVADRGWKGEDILGRVDAARPISELWGGWVWPGLVWRRGNLSPRARGFLGGARPGRGPVPRRVRPRRTRRPRGAGAWSGTRYAFPGTCPG